MKDELIVIAYSDIFGSLEKQATAAAKLSPSGRHVRKWDRVICVQILLVLLMMVLVMYMDLDDNI